MSKENVLITAVICRDRPHYAHCPFEEISDTITKLYDKYHATFYYVDLDEEGVSNEGQ